MSNWVLGISGYYHDSAAAITKDGEIIAAAQEERFSRKKHDPRFPQNAINFCLEEAFIDPSELSAVVFYDNPILTWDRVVKNCISSGESSFEHFKKASQSIFGHKVWIKEQCQNFLGSLGSLNKLLITEHHMSHAASAFYPSNLYESAIITLDGVGEWSTMTMGYGEGNDLNLLKKIDYPSSLGLLYSAITYYCGFKVNSGEYKLMGLAPYGDPIYYEIMLKELIDIKEDGSFRLNMNYFGYMDSDTMTNDAFNNLFEGPPRKPESIITKREMDIASSVQKITEQVVLAIARNAKYETGSKNIVLAGGVALNCVANGKLLKENLFDNVWIQPAAGDAGGALGASLLVSYKYFNIDRKILKSGRDLQKGSYLGPKYSNEEIHAFLNRNNYPYEKISSEKQITSTIAKAIADGKIIGLFQGKMEYGPRALGNRSILGDARKKGTQTAMNLKIKYRESFRPFAPSVLSDDVNEYFELDVESPYMLLVANVQKDRIKPINKDKWWDNNDDLMKIINEERSDIPAVTHVDHSARIQTVNKLDNSFYYNVIKNFKKLTGYGVIVNTSFNVRGEPIVCTPHDAYKCFMRTEIDLLVLENFLIWKDKQPTYEDNIDWREEYELD